MRTRIFVDFWNLQLSFNERMNQHYRLDWKKLPSRLILEAEKTLSATLEFEGIHVYISYDPKKETDRNLRRWASNTLAQFPGYRVVLKERKAKSPPTCPNCNQQIATCPHCGQSTVGTIEKGIDTSITTDMISLAWEQAWDIALLVSSDRDFVPVVEFLDKKGKRVINAHFPPLGADLARACWASINLLSLGTDLARPADAK